MNWLWWFGFKWPGWRERVLLLSTKFVHSRPSTPAAAHGHPPFEGKRSSYFSRQQFSLEFLDTALAVRVGRI